MSFLVWRRLDHNRQCGKRERNLFDEFARVNQHELPGLRTAHERPGHPSEVYYAVLAEERKDTSSLIGQEMQVLHDPKQLAAMGFGEGIGFVPFASVGWDTMQTIMKDKKSGAVVKAAIISALATDPDVRTDDLLLKYAGNPQWVLRVAALEAIEKRGKPSLRAAILKSMDDPKYHVKYTPAATIAYLNDVADVHGAEK